MTIPATPSSDQQHRRIAWVARALVVAISVLLLGLVVRVVQLQLRPEQPVAQRIANRGADTTILSRRGSILDARGRSFASSHVAHRLFADPQNIHDYSTFAAIVADVLGLDAARIEQAISDRFDAWEAQAANRPADRPLPPLRYVVIEDRLTEQQVDKIPELSSKLLEWNRKHEKELARRGKLDPKDRKGNPIGVEPGLVRRYAQGALAGQVVGYVGSEHQGQEGIELALNERLTGAPGMLSTLRDARRRPLWVEEGDFKPSRDGRDVKLSIDAVVQAIAESELHAVCKAHRALTGEIVVLDSRTGQILAMANWPSFDPGTSNRADEIARRNRCATDLFEPGSIFKPFVHAAATSMGLAKPHQVVDTGGGLWITPYGRKLRDAHAHGAITWEQVLIVSSNIGMGKIAEPMGARKMFDAVRAFGFGQPSGASLPAESPGLVNPLKQWNKYSLTSVPMGQEIGVTPLQLAKGLTAFCNGGLVVSPSILADEARRPIYQRAIDAQTADFTRLLMRRVVTEGTGRRAESKLFQIWGKTGTAQVPDRVRGGYKPRAYNASFIGGAPLREPRVVVVVTVHEPDPSIAYYGGVVAAPVAKNVIEQTLTYLGVAPDVEPGSIDDRAVASHAAPRD